MFDLNVLLDTILERDEFYYDSSAVCDFSVRHQVVGFVPVHAITTILYLVQRAGGRAKSRIVLDWILQNFKIASCSAADIFHATELPFDDFEDAVVCAAAESSRCDLIITRDLADFSRSPVRAISPRAFLDERYFGGGFVHEPEVKYGSDGRDERHGRNGNVTRPRVRTKNKRGGL